MFVYQVSQEKRISKKIFNQSYSSPKILIENFAGGRKIQVSLQNFVFEFREKSLLQTILALSKCHVSDSRRKSPSFVAVILHKKNLPIDALRKEVMPIIIGKNEIEKGQNLRLLAHCAVWFLHFQKSEWKNNVE